MKKPDDDEFTAKEAAERFAAALRGARIAGHKPLESLTKRAKAAKSAKRKRATKAR